MYECLQTQGHLDSNNNDNKQSEMGEESIWLKPQRPQKHVYHFVRKKRRDIRRE